MLRRLAALGLLIGLASATVAQAHSDGYLPVESPPPSAHTRTVASGDHFWLIAVEHLTETLDRRPNRNEVAAYWRELVAANIQRIRSRDADLIYPGEVVTLP